MYRALWHATGEQRAFPTETSRIPIDAALAKRPQNRRVHSKGERVNTIVVLALQVMPQIGTQGHSGFAAYR